MTVGKLESTWESRDFPVLLAIGKAVEADGEPRMWRQHLDPGVADLTDDEVFNVLKALESDGLVVLVGNSSRGMINARELTAEGRRKIGLWPSSENDLVNAFIAALDHLIETCGDPEEKSRLRTIKRELAHLTRATVAAMAAAGLRTAAGM